MKKMLGFLGMMAGIFLWAGCNTNSPQDLSVGPTGMQQMAATDPCTAVQGGGAGLKGTVFGLNPPYAAGSEYCKATDGNINTFYDYSQANGAYTGLDLGTPQVISRIRYYPRNGFASRMNGGKFQGANSAGGPYTDLYTIAGTPAQQWNTGMVPITITTPFRYLRYLAPNGSYGNIAEMEFYAPSTQTYTISASAGPNGYINPNGSVTITSGNGQVFTMVPNSGYKVNSVTVDGANQGSITSYTFSNVLANHTISATFTASSSDPCGGVQGGGAGLKGTVFGLNPPYAAGSEYCKATDGNTGTFYDAQQANGAYTGLDFGSAKVIGKIRYYPRANFASRMNGGKFQGSNTSSGSGFVDLYTISGTPAVQWNTVTITNSTAYRWVRYLAPNNSYGNIAEVEFYAPSCPAPVITTQPGSIIFCISGSASLSVIAANAVSYQWYNGKTYDPNGIYCIKLSDGNGVSGSKTPTLTISGFGGQSVDNPYFCAVTNSCGTTVYSNAGIISGYEGPKITAQPLSVNTCDPYAYFNVTAIDNNNNGTIMYQWYLNGTALSDNYYMVNGAQGAALTLFNTASNYGTLYCVVSCSIGGCPTQTATVTFSNPGNCQ